jgi:predicted nucleotidyltransferase component of viral defense system
MPDSTIGYHEDSQLFRDALRFTAAQTEFSERLIEKDYYCTLVLADLHEGKTQVVFKGGTCLSKVHADFFRLSEDLDFCVSTSIRLARSQRSKLIDTFKIHLAAIEKRQSVLRVVAPLTGFNNSKQCSGRLAYRSAVTGEDEFIKIEVSVREPVIESAVSMPARTLLMDPFRRSRAIPAVSIPVLTMREAYSEKLRAALTRRDPAIRDFFDLQHAISEGSIDTSDRALLALVEQKLSIPGNEPIDMSRDKLKMLRDQLKPQLNPVLRAKDFLNFDLESTFERVSELASRLKKTAE